MANIGVHFLPKFYLLELDIVLNKHLLHIHTI